MNTDSFNHTERAIHRFGRAVAFLIGAFLIAVTCLIFALALFVGSKAFGGEANLEWDASVGADGYRVYVSDASGDYSPNPVLEVGATTTPVQLADGCAKQYIVVTAYNVAGESAYSNEVDTYPRPLVAGNPTKDNGNLVFLGGNFATTIAIRINGSSIDSSFIDRVSCTELRLPVITIPTGNPGAPVVFELCNGPVCKTWILVPVSAPGNARVN